MLLLVYIFMTLTHTTSFSVCKFNDLKFKNRPLVGLRFFSFGNFKSFPAHIRHHIIFFVFAAWKHSNSLKVSQISTGEVCVYVRKIQTIREPLLVSSSPISSPFIFVFIRLQDILMHFRWWNSIKIIYGIESLQKVGWACIFGALSNGRLRINFLWQHGYSWSGKWDGKSDIFKVAGETKQNSVCLLMNESDTDSTSAFRLCNFFREFPRIRQLIAIPNGWHINRIRWPIFSSLSLSPRSMVNTSGKWTRRGKVPRLKTCMRLHRIQGLAGVSISRLVSRSIIEWVWLKDLSCNEVHCEIVYSFTCCLLSLYALYI